MKTVQADRPTLPTESPLEARQLTLAEHLEELRRALGVSLAAFVLGAGISWAQVERIIGWLQRPAEGRLPHFAFFTPTEPLTAYLKVSALCGVVFAMPVILWQAWRFARSGLTGRERRYGLAFIWWGSGQFLLGAALAYYGLVPVALRLLLEIGRGRFEPVISLGAYLSFVTTLLFWCGLLCELPVVLWLLASAGVVTSEWLRQQRPYAILILVLAAAVITPTTDPVNLLLMALPMLGLYELSIVVTRWAMPPGGGGSP